MCIEMIRAAEDARLTVSDKVAVLIVMVYSTEYAWYAAYLLWGHDVHLSSHVDYITKSEADKERF